jgi:hypothetical protein
MAASAPIAVQNVCHRPPDKLASCRWHGSPTLAYIADGFYEWKKIGPKEEQPYFITTKGNVPSSFAGLYEPESIVPQDAFTILTCVPNELCAKVHDCMPVMLARADISDARTGYVSNRQASQNNAAIVGSAVIPRPNARPAGVIRYGGRLDGRIWAKTGPPRWANLRQMRTYRLSYRNVTPFQWRACSQFRSCGEEVCDY